MSAVASARLSKLQLRWIYALFLCSTERTSEILVGTANGAIKAPSVRRLTEELRQDASKPLPPADLDEEVSKQWFKTWATKREQLNSLLVYVEFWIIVPLGSSN